MLTLHSIDHYISHPVVTLTTTRCLSPLQLKSSPMGFHRNSYLWPIWRPDFLVCTSAIWPMDPHIWRKLGGGGGLPRNSYLLTWHIWRWSKRAYITTTTVRQLHNTISQIVKNIANIAIRWIVAGYNCQHTRTHTYHMLWLKHFICKPVSVDI